MNNRGFALISALWLLVAFSVIGLELGTRSRARRLAVANGVESTALRAEARGALAHLHAMLDGRMLELRRSGALDPNRLLDPWGDLVADAKVAEGVTLRDAGSYLNLNLASEDQFRRFLVALDVDYPAADRIAQAVSDWKDADQAHRARGAEAETYLKEGLPHLPANAPFESIQELSKVRGVSAPIHARVSPYLTLDGSGRINLNQAPEAVILSLPGMTDAAAQVLVRRAHSDRPIRNLADLLLELSEGPRNELQTALTDLNGRVLFETQEVIATAEAHRTGSPVRVRVSAVIVRVGDGAMLTTQREGR
jgi:general secretion pathway protein K